MPIDIAKQTTDSPIRRYQNALAGMNNRRVSDPLAESVGDPDVLGQAWRSFTRDSIVGSAITDFIPYQLGKTALDSEVDPEFDVLKFIDEDYLRANPHMVDPLASGDLFDIPNRERFLWYSARAKEDYDIRQRLGTESLGGSILTALPGQIVDGLVGGLALRGLGLAGKAAQAGEWLKAGGTAAKFGKSAMLGASLNLAQEEALRALNPSRHVDEGQAALWAVGLGAAFGSGAHFIASGKTRLGKWMDPIRAKILSQQIASELSDPKFHGLDDVAAADEAMLRNEVGTSVGAATPSETRLREGEIKRFTVLRTPITKQLMKEVEAHYKGGVEWNEHPQQWAYDAKKALEELDAEAKKYAPADLGPVQNAVVNTLGFVTPAKNLSSVEKNPSAFSRLVARTLFDFTLPTQESFDNPLTNVVNTPAEGLRMVYNGWAAESRLAYDEAFREAWQGKATARLSDGSDVTIGRGSKHEFSRAVQERIFAMHEEGRGQRAPSVVHPAIQKAADTLNEYYRKIGFEGKASGYLNYTTNPALPHFTQQWLTDVVERNKSDFIARLKTQWEKNRRIDYDTGTPIDPETWTTDNKVVNPEKISKGANAGGLTKADREAINAYAINNEMSVNEVTLANLRDEFGQDLLDRYEQELQIYYQKAAESTYDSLTHIDNGHGVLDAMDSIPADVREGRILKIDPTQFVDYLERDAVRLLESYDHMVSGRISTRMAIKRDVKNIDKWYKPLMGRSIAADDYNPQMLIEAINEDFKAKIADERITTDLKDRYQHARDMLIGEKNGLLTSKLAELERRESGRPVGWKLFAERNIIRMPFLAQMGKVTIAAFNDLAGTAFVKRLAPEQVGTVRSILKPFVGAPRRDIQGAYVAVVDAIRGLRGDDLVDFSPNIERARFGHGIGGTVMSAVDTATGWMQKKLVQATGINRWSQGMRRFMAGGIMQDIIVGAKKMHQASILVGRGMKQEEAFAKVGLDIADARRLNRLGINSERATRLLEKIDQHGVDYEGNRVDNTHDGFISPEMNKWWAEDRDLYYTLNNAVNSETLNLVVEPKILSRPLMNNTLLGKLFNQFQGFAMAWGTQLAPLAMQRGGHEIAMYAGLMVGLGAIADALRNELTGRRTIGDTIDMWQKNPAGMVYAAVDRSGMTGWLSRPLGLLEQTPFGIAKNLKNTGLSTQYGRQGPLIDQLGPVFGWSNKVYSGVMAGMYDGGWNRKNQMLLWRATPFNNLWAVEGFNRVAERMGFQTPIGPQFNYREGGR